MDDAATEQLTEEMLLPFQDNRSGSLRDYRADLVEAFGRADVELRQRRIDPLTLYRDTLGSIRTNLAHRDYKAAVIDIVVGGLIQAIPAYQRTEFEMRGEGRKGFKRITFYKTGLVLEPATLAATYLLLGFPVPLVNILNWMGSLLLGRRDDIHEWNHAFDKFVIQALFNRGIIDDVEAALVDINADLPEPPYEVRNRQELHERAKCIVERVLTGSERCTTAFPLFPQ